MKKSAKTIICFALAMCMLLGAAGTALAGTDWNTALRNNTCTQSRYTPQGWGCAAYIYYRIVQGKARDNAKSSCTYGCEQIHPSALSACQAGCDRANGEDYGSW